MNLEEKDVWEQFLLIKSQFPERKQGNVDLLIRVYLEVMERCPYIAEAPMEEKMELIRILREINIL